MAKLRKILLKFPISAIIHSVQILLSPGSLYNNQDSFGGPDYIIYRNIADIFLQQPAEEEDDEEEEEEDNDDDDSETHDDDEDELEMEVTYERDSPVDPLR